MKLTSQTKQLLKQLLLFLLSTYTILVYVLFIFNTHRDIFATSYYPYYTDLTTSLLQGRLDVLVTDTFDLSLFKGKWYPYWGPAPVIFVLPFYFLIGANVSDVFYTLIAGLGNILIFYLVLLECKKYFSVKLSGFSQIVLVLSFAIASPNFYLTITGRVWGTYQIIATFYLLVFLLFFFKYLNQRKFIQFLLAVVFFQLAWLSRYNYIFYGLFFIYPLWEIFRSAKLPHFRRELLTLLSITFLGLSCLLFYNYVRFENAFETGLRYQIGSPRALEIIQSGKIFSLDYITHNSYYYFLNFAYLTFESPYINNVSLEGNSIFSLYPLLFLLVFIFQKKYFKNTKTRNFLLLSVVTVACITTVLLCFFATGWLQLGSRYYLDCIPLLFLVISLTLQNVPLIIRASVLVYGIIINIVGVIHYLYLYMAQLN